MAAEEKYLLSEWVARCVEDAATATGVTRDEYAEEALKLFLKQDLNVQRAYLAQAVRGEPPPRSWWQKLWDWLRGD